MKFYSLLVITHLVAFIFFWNTNHVLNNTLKRSTEDLRTVGNYFAGSDTEFNQEQKGHLIRGFIKKQTIRDEYIEEANSSFIFYFFLSIFSTYLFLFMKIYSDKK